MTEPALQNILPDLRDCRRDLEAAREVLRLGVHLSGGWREAVVELEDFCSEPVRLKNMVAAADQIDDWRDRACRVLGEEP